LDGALTMPAMIAASGMASSLALWPKNRREAESMP
jgi:hypothetical protein